MGLRERKKAETRSALSWAAVRLAVERGFGDVKVEDIAEAVGVSPRTFNNYFAGKGEAIAARHLDRCLGIAETVRAATDRPLWDAIRGSVLRQFEPDAAAHADPPVELGEWTAGVRVMLAEPALHGEMLRAESTAEAELAAAVAERTDTDAERDLYPKLVASAVLAATRAAMSHYLGADPPVPIERLLAEAFDSLAAGLPTP